MSEIVGSEPVELTERSGSVVDAPEESDETKAQREADAKSSRRAAAASNPEDAPQQEAVAAQEGDDEFLSGAWNGHPNHKCPDCHIAFLDIQGGSQAVRVHRRSAHPGGK
jgi:hypothetical protein